MLKTFFSELLHLGLLNASECVLAAGSQLAEGRSRTCTAVFLLRVPRMPECCCSAVGSAQGRGCREHTGVLGRAAAWQWEITQCSAATLQNQITTFQSSDLVPLHPTRYKIIPLCSQKSTLPFSFNTSIPLILCQQGQKKICFQGLVKKYLSK